MTVPVLPSLGRHWNQARYWVREFFGENDYARYVAEWQARHAELAPDETHHLMTEREFFDYQLQVKFGGAIQRC